MSPQGIHSLCETGVREGAFPGGGWAVGVGGRLESGFFGSLTKGGIAPERATWWDLASLTKVICTTTLCARAWEQGRLDLDAPVQHYLPQFSHAGVTIRHLLTHSSGLIPFRDFSALHGPESAQKIRAAIMAEPLQSAPGDKVAYSDLGFILLGWILEEIWRRPLESIFAQEVAKPYRLMLGYRPHDDLLCAPTEVAEPWRRNPGVPLVGEVHDPTCGLLGGVAGHAGLFGTLDGVASFARALMAGDLYSHDTLNLWAARVPPETRGLGWDTNWDHRTSAGQAWPIRAFGHTGFTGTSLFIDPDSGGYAVLLTNRVHPSAENRKILEFRPKFYAAAWELLRSF